MHMQGLVSVRTQQLETERKDKNSLSDACAAAKAQVEELKAELAGVVQCGAVCCRVLPSVSDKESLSDGCAAAKAKIEDLKAQLAGVLQCGAVWCSVVQCGAVCCGCIVLQCVAMCCSTAKAVCVVAQCVSQCVWQWIVSVDKAQLAAQLCNSVLQCVAVWCGVLQCVAMCCSVLL